MSTICARTISSVQAHAMTVTGQAKTHLRLLFPLRAKLPQPPRQLREPPCKRVRRLLSGQEAAKLRGQRGEREGGDV